ALVHEGGREVYSGAFGMADREAGRPMARDTLAQVYSMTKPVTGVVLMSLHEEGLFDIDAPLSTYLPEYASVQVHAGEDADGKPVLVAPERPILRSEEHTSELQSRENLVCRLLLEKKKYNTTRT